MDWRVTAAYALVVGGLSCAQALGLDAYDGGGGPTETGSGGSGGSGGGSVGCGDGTVCASEVPAGWDGPIVLLPSPSACSGDFPDPAFGGELVDDVPAAVCSCACTASPPMCEIDVATYLDGGCSGLPSRTYPFTTTSACASVSPAPNGELGFKSTPNMVIGSCTPSDDVELPPIVSTSVRGCRAEPTEVCASGKPCVRLPASAIQRVCVWTDQDVPCPGSGYSVPLRIARGQLVDERGCTPCSCPTPPTGAACNGTTMTMTGTCGSLATADHNGQCVSTPSFSKLAVNINPVAGQCAAEGGMPIGEVALGDAVVACCTPEL